MWEILLRAGQTVNVPSLAAYMAALAIAFDCVEYRVTRLVGGVWVASDPYIVIHCGGLTGKQAAAIQDAVTTYTVDP